MELVELKIHGISYSDNTSGAFAIILDEVNGNKKLPIVIGSYEAQSIAIALEKKIKTSRPLTHDLLTSVISDMGGQIESVIVSELKNDTFYAKILISSGDNLIEIDSRPSDAIAVAIRSDVPIFVEDDVVTKAGVVFEGQEEFETEDGLPQKPIDDQELESLSVFSEFIDSLDLGDLGDQ